MSKIGFLAPDGIFYPCTSWGHTKRAEQICSRMGINVSGIEAEDILMDKGFVCLRARDAYYNHWKKDMDCCNILTEAQITFLKACQRNVSCVNKYDAIQKIIDTNDDSLLYYNNDGTPKVK